MHNQPLVSERLKTMKASSGQKFSNLYQHLSQLLTRLPIKKDKLNNLKNLQNISQFIKKTNFKSIQPQYQQQIQIQNNKTFAYPSWISVQDDIIQGSQEIKNMGNVLIQNYSQTAGLFQQAGISFGQQINYKIGCLLKKIALKLHAISLRYWGKILTKNGDYHILQGVATKNNPQSILSGDMQKYRQGANYYSYWVSQNIISQNWIELPLITPQQLIISKKLKYIFTGNLNNNIHSYPKFPGLEKHLLKAQLVRITHNCEISPKGLYTTLEQNPDQIDFSEQFKFPEFGQLSNLQNWVHTNPYILHMGRASYYVDPKTPEDQRQEILAKLAENDPKIQRLKGINEDKAPEKTGFQGTWITKVIGNTQVFNNIGKQEGTTSCYGFVTLKNVNWPGWLTVSSSKAYGSIYIGYGFKITQSSFFPISPQDILIQGQDIDQFPQPNPKDPPDELEPDSQQQNKKQQQ